MALWLVLAAPFPGVAQSGAKLEAFAPKGWAIEQRINGDLDGDGNDDAVLVLLQEGDADRFRALVVVRAVKDGFALLATNSGLAACFQCLGIKGGDGAPTVTIEKRVLVIEQSGGSREAYGATHRFRLDKDGLGLIGVDHFTSDALDGAGKSTSENFITGAVVTETRLGDSPPLRKRTKVAVRPLQRFEEVTEYGE